MAEPRPGDKRSPQQPDPSTQTEDSSAATIYPTAEGRSNRPESRPTAPSAPLAPTLAQTAAAPAVPGTLAPPAPPKMQPSGARGRPALVLAGHEILAELGRGGMGVVYKGRHRTLNRTVALKVIRGGHHADDQAVARFRVEAEAVARLQHPNIVQIHEVGETDGQPFLSLEFVEGGTLESKLCGTPQPPRAAAELVEQLARAIHFAHQRGIVHRDLKPANVLLAAPEPGTYGEADRLFGQPKITDFGLAKKLDNQAGQTQSGDILGSPSYMAPEQAGGQPERIGPGTDVYALGAILYEMLTGQPPFKAATLLETVQSVLSQDALPPRQLQPKVPRDLEIICLKCLQKDPRQRYATALDLAEDLHHYRSGEPILARPVGNAERLWRWCRRNPVAVLLLVTVVVGSTLGLWQMSRLSDQLMREMALESLAHEAAMLEDVNNVYSREVVPRAKKGGAKTAHDFMDRDGTIPIPATFTIILGWEMSKGGAGKRVRLYSDYPFRTRFEGGPQDDFERAALAHLRQNPREPYYEFEEIGSVPFVRYGTARVMQTACVECHNTHPDSTKKDWKVGDVRGVLEIVRPLIRDQKRIDEQLQGTVILMVGGFVALLVVSGLVLIVGNRRRRRQA